MVVVGGGGPTTARIAVLINRTRANGVIQLLQPALFTAQASPTVIIVRGAFGIWPFYITNISLAR